MAKPSIYSAYARDPLNPQASVLVDAQTDIKTVIKNGVLNGAPFSVIQAKVRLLIDDALAKIKSNTLKTDARFALMKFANRVYTQLKLEFPDPSKTKAMYTLVKAVSSAIADGKLPQNAEIYKFKTPEERKAFKELYGDTFTTHAKGVPLQEFSKVYIKRVSEAMHRLAEQQALDPNDINGRNSLRNLAEMQVRYERHQEEIADLRDSGVKLVICSVHEDCSARCSKWQGRVYSLDGTSGKTADGRKFVPLEEATDNPEQRTKKGVPNGLLGYNCRHKLSPYKEGMLVPYVSKETQVKEREITRRQRELERTVIKWREEALAQKGNAVEYEKAKAKAKEWYEIYINYSRENKRAYEPDRVKIL